MQPSKQISMHDLNDTRLFAFTAEFPLLHSDYSITVSVKD